MPVDLAPVLENATRLRRELHRIPELGYDENDTAARIRGELDRLGIAYLVGPETAPTATVAVLGDRAKPCVLLRADIDALPIVEESGVAHASERAGRMHACGHDGHAANLVAVAQVLAGEADDLPVCVKLVWQPAEEGGGGGRKLVEAGLLEETEALGPKVVAAFGLHGWPKLPVGVVSTRPGPLLAATDTFSATFVGKGGHAAFPHFTRDPVTAAASAVLSLQNIRTRELDPTEPAVISVTQLDAGSARNVIPDEASLAGTCRTLTRGTRRYCREAVGRRLRGVAEAGGCDVRFEWSDGYPPTVNDAEMAQFVRRIAGDRFVPAASPVLGGEDFAYYLERVPGCFFMIGLHPPGGTWPDLHTAAFDFNDAALATGLEMMLGLVRGFDPAVMTTGGDGAKLTNM
jgi:amidohydrolase